MTEPRRFTLDSPNGGRFDTEGIEWFACDPYPTWYRWVDGNIVVRPTGRRNNPLVMPDEPPVAAPWADTGSVW